MDSGSPASEDEVLADDLENFEFDEWKELFERDPELFDRYRKKLLEHQITLAPESARPRLQGLMFQMEAEALRSPTPISYSIRLSSMMMEKFEELREKLALLTGASDDFDKAFLQKPESAEIVPFGRFKIDKNR